MNNKERREITPQEHIGQLFAATKAGEMPITYEPFLDSPYTLTYKVNWTREDANRLVEEYTALTESLTRIGKLHKKLVEEEGASALLSAHDFAVWNTYIRPFEEPFEVDDDMIADLYVRMEDGVIEDEEVELLERHHEWFVLNSLKRLPLRGEATPAKLLNRARRYERLIALNAPADVVAEEGRCLAEEMVLYYHMV